MSHVYKTQDYESYATWKSLPSFLRGQPRQVLEKFGIDDELVIGLLEIKSQTEFSRKFNIDPGTLTDWNKKLEEEGYMELIRKWGRNLTKNVIGGLYRNASKNGRAAEVKTWLENIENM